MARLIKNDDFAFRSVYMFSKAYKVANMAFFFTFNSKFSLTCLSFNTISLNSTSKLIRFDQSLNEADLKSICIVLEY